MAKVELKGDKGPSWACTCPARKEYPEDRVPALLDRAREVNVRLARRWPSGVVDYLTWTGKDVYTTTYSPMAGRQVLCKHIMAAAWFESGLLDQLRKEQEEDGGSATAV